MLSSERPAPLRAKTGGPPPGVEPGCPAYETGARPLSDEGRLGRVRPAGRGQSFNLVTQPIRPDGGEDGDRTHEALLATQCSSLLAPPRRLVGSAHRSCTYPTGFEPQRSPVEPPPP